MKNKLLCIFMTVAMLFSALSIGIAANSTDVSEWDGSTDTELVGSGTLSEPYLITSAAELAGFAANVNGGNQYVGKYVKLMCDVDLNNIAWTPIGNKSSISFCGVFDGNGKTVSNLNVTERSYAGFFGYVKGGVITNLGIVGGTVNGLARNCGTGNASPNGGFAAFLDRSTVVNCYTTANVSTRIAEGGYGFTGGFVGRANNTCQLISCYSFGNVTATADSGKTPVLRVAGFVGMMSKGLITDCVATGNVTINGDAKHCAGFIGLTDYAALVSCESYGKITVSGTTDTCGNFGGALNIGNGCSFAGCIARATDDTDSSFTTTNIGIRVIDDSIVAPSLTELKSASLCTERTVISSQKSKWDGAVSDSLSGSGTKADPYLIQSGADLAFVAQKVNSATTPYSAAGTFYKVTTSIDLDGIEWTPIGTSSAPFRGVVIGNSHNVFNINTKNTAYNGLFGNVSGAVFANYGVASGTINGNGDYVGGFVGYANKSTFVNCVSAVNVNNMSSFTAGFCGMATNYTLMYQCKNYGDITVSGAATSCQRNAGFVGAMTADAAAICCINSGNTTVKDIATANKCAGFIGLLTGRVIACTNYGEIDVVTPITTADNKTSAFVSYANGDTSAIELCSSVTSADASNLYGNLYNGIRTTGISEIADTLVLDAYSLGVDMAYGASIRFDNPTGMRFITMIDKTAYDALVAKYGVENITVGTIIAPADYVKEAGEFSVEALSKLNHSTNYLDVVAKESNTKFTTDDSYAFAGSIAKIKTNNYDEDFCGIGYISINTGTETITVYATTYVQRNVREIARLAYNDPDGGYDTDEMGILENFING